MKQLKYFYIVTTITGPLRQSWPIGLQENNSIYLPNPLAPVAPLLLHASRTFLSEAGASAIFLNKVNKNLQKKINIKKDVKVRIIAMYWARTIT